MKYCVGLVVKDRWNLTSKMLDSLFHTEQEKSFDFYIISNGSSPSTNQNLKTWISGGFVPVKNLICTPEFSIPQIWNLFLMLAKNSPCPYRVMLQNDLVFHGTPVNLTDAKPQAPKARLEPPPMLGVNPGAIPNLGATISRGVSHSRRSAVTMSTCFLDLLAEYTEEHDLSLCSLPFLSANQLPNWFLKKSAQQSYKNMPFIKMGVTLITDKAFNRLGYFDERLPRMIDVDYSQRALRQKMNIGYHNSYWTYDIGSDNPTEGSSVAEHKRQIAMSILDTLGPVENDYASTIWEDPKKERAILKAVKKNKIVNVSI